MVSKGNLGRKKKISKNVDFSLRGNRAIIQTYLGVCAWLSQRIKSTRFFEGDPPTKKNFILGFWGKQYIVLLN